jgi:N-acetylglutamate synthase-like GNAT family acetyltransferase
VSGIDIRGIYHSFRIEWKTSLPICLYKNKEIIGICKLKKLEKKSMYLSCLVIVDRLQGLGFGSRLLNYSFALAKFAGMERVFLEVKKDNKIARKCFGKHGFSYNKEDQETYMMVKFL